MYNSILVSGVQNDDILLVYIAKSSPQSLLDIHHHTQSQISFDENF